MEDHEDAYFFWKELGVRGASCLHVDAHLDLSNFKVTRSASWASPISGANFLYYACQEAIVSRLVWVIPPHLRQGKPWLQWAQSELKRRLHLTVDEYLSVEVRENRVQAVVAGARLTICEANNLPPLAGPWLLDIDIDYFLDDQDRIWQNPFGLRQLLLGAQLETFILTVAYSVNGGYTPLVKRYLGDLSLLVFGGQLEEAKRLWRWLENSDGDQEAEVPTWLKAAALLERAWQAGQDHQGSAWEKAAAIDCAYRVSPANVASYYLNRKNLPHCLFWLDKLTGESRTALALLQGYYLAGLAGFRCADFTLAAEKWQEILDFPECLEKAVLVPHILEMRGRALQRLGRFGQASRHFREALRLDPRDPLLWLEMARCQGACGGTLEKAVASYQTFLNLAPDWLDALEARGEMAEITRQLDLSFPGPG